jgi:hypothetical protein
MTCQCRGEFRAARAPTRWQARNRSYDNPGGLKYFFARFSGIFAGAADCLCALALVFAHDGG